MICINLLNPHYQTKEFKQRADLRFKLDRFSNLTEGNDYNWEILGYMLMLGFLLGIITGLVAGKGMP